MVGRPFRCLIAGPVPRLTQLDVNSFITTLMNKSKAIPEDERASMISEAWLKFLVGEGVTTVIFGFEGTASSGYWLAKDFVTARDLMNGKGLSLYIADYKGKEDLKLKFSVQILELNVIVVSLP